MMECKRCGNCCKDVGRTFWKNIRIDLIDNPSRLSKELWLRLKDGDHEDGGLPCEMLLFVTDGLATCILQRDYKIKPSVCNDHEGDERCQYIIDFLEGAKE